MSKRILLLAIGATLLFGSTRVFADSITIEHVQITLGTELMDGLGDPGFKATDTVTITVTNKTDKTWADYSIKFVTPKGGGSLDNVLTISDVGLETNPFSTASILANNKSVGKFGKRAVLLLTGGDLAPGGTFKIKLNLEYNNSVDVLGTPSTTTPETSSLWLMGTGLLALAPVIRRKLRM